MRWKPKVREKYWCIEPMYTFNIRKFTNINGDADKLYIKIGNCFCTKAEAQAMASKIKKLLKEK